MSDIKFSSDTLRAFREIYDKTPPEDVYLGISKLINNPQKAANDFGLSISDDVAKDLLKLNEMERILLPDVEDKKSYDTLRKVFVDGRYIKELFTDPQSVATKLHLDLDDETLNYINGFDFEEEIPTNTYLPTASLGLAIPAVGLAIYVAYKIIKHGYVPIDDFSNLPKI